MFILTDDQDIKLKSLDVQPKLHSLLINEGVMFNNAFVTTPVCCPSRCSCHSYQLMHAVTVDHQFLLENMYTIIILMRIVLNEVVMHNHGVTRMRRRLLDITWAWPDTRLDSLVCTSSLYHQLIVNILTSCCKTTWWVMWITHKTIIFRLLYGC